MVRETDWDNKEQALERLREIYPHMKEFLIDICYDLYKQSETDVALQEEIQKHAEHDFSVKPTMADFDGYEYDGGVKIHEAGTFKHWACTVCDCTDEKKKSEWDNKYCDFCWKYEENKISTDIIKDECEKYT
jgi:hypothetical protein